MTDRLLAQLREENDTLREKLAQVMALLVETAPIPSAWGLTKSEACIFGILANREIATRAAIMVALYQERDEADEQVITVYVSKLRRKLKPFGFVITTLWGRGYALSPHSREKWRLKRRPRLGQW